MPSTPPGLPVLVVDDEECSRELLRVELEELGLHVVEARDGEHAWSCLESRRFAIVVTDLRMPRSDGMALLRRLRSPSSPQPDVPVILVSSRGTLSTAVSAGRSGATDFFPLDAGGMAQLVERIQGVLSRSEGDLPPPLLGESDSVRGVRRRINALASGNATAMILGPEGAGRRDIVGYLHRRSASNTRALVEFRSTSAEDLSRCGTVYVSDMETLSREDQTRLSDLLDQVESLSPSSAFRVIGSAETDLVAEAQEGSFDANLAARLGRFVVRLCPIDERSEDIAIVANGLAERAASRLGKAKPVIEPAAISVLSCHSWPGDIAQLESAIETLVAFTPNGVVSAAAAKECLAELDFPLKRIAERRKRRERRELIELYEKHGTFSGVAEELGITRNAAKYRLAKHNLIPSTPVRRS